MKVSWFTAAAVIVAGLLAQAGAAHAAVKESVLDVFTGPNGAYPDGGVLLGNNNLYGTTVYGGLDTNCPQHTYTKGDRTITIPAGCGVVYQLSPPAAGQTAWKQTILFKFPGQASGANPIGSLVLGNDHNLYGTTRYGGYANGCPGYINTFKVTKGCGVVFKLTPPAAGQSAWTETVIFTFHGADGAGPVITPLSVDQSTRLFGVTIRGGPSAAACPASNISGDPAGCGTVFQLTPPAAGKTVWTIAYLHQFTGGTDGAAPTGGYFYNFGGLFGTTSAGGGTAAACPADTVVGSLAGCGTVFKLTEPASGKAPWPETIIDHLAGAPHPATPFGGLIYDNDGNLYGTSFAGGTSKNQFAAGTVFRLTPPASGQTAWTETVLHSFTGPDGAKPQTGLVRGLTGTFYGATDFGGTGEAGTVYELTAPAAGQTAWTEKVLYNFGANGYDPITTLYRDPSSGALFGTTYVGKSSSTGVNYSEGTVFEIKP